jgi:CRP/FNR family cyclic AMP-dependent transcriptional regulator
VGGATKREGWGDQVGAFRPGSFLASLDAADLETVRSVAHVRSAHRGDTLLRESDPPSTVLMLIAGSVKLTKLAVSGREVVLGLRGPGDVVGELGALDGRPRSASVVAIGEVEALSLTTEAFDKLLRERAGFGRALQLTITARLRDASDRQLEHGTSDVMARVCKRLTELADSHGVAVDSGIMIAHAVSQQELAQWTGISRDGVVRALSDLRAADLVDTGRQRILIKNVSGVRSRAGCAPCS